jgi:hypothetical protein
LLLNARRSKLALIVKHSMVLSRRCLIRHAEWFTLSISKYNFFSSFVIVIRLIRMLMTWSTSSSTAALSTPLLNKVSRLVMRSSMPWKSLTYLRGSKTKTLLSLTWTRTSANQ